MTKPTIRLVQPAHPHSLIRVLTDRMCFLQPLGYLKQDKQELLPYWVAVQANLGLYFSTGLIVSFVLH